MKANTKNGVEAGQGRAYATSALKQEWQQTSEIAMRLTGMDEMEYAQGVYESGLLYLGLYWRDDARWVNRWSSSRTFWLWWRNQWARKDESLLPMLTEIVEKCRMGGEYLEPRTLRPVYMDEHSGQQALLEFRPNRCVAGKIESEVKNG